ncbi:TIGR02281 family clan AA aspartic protease [Colwelliaceae bacterium 6471]
MTEDDVTNKMGKYFVWIAWLLAIGLVTFFFQDLLDKQWNPNTNPEVYLNQSGQAEVRLEQNRHGHYVTQGMINELSVTFLLDTGATQVSIPGHIAQQLNLPRGIDYRVQTANGTVTVYQTKLEQLQIGNIFLYNVAAHINPAMQSDEILLGMSALKRVEFSQTGKQLILRERN